MAELYIDAENAILGRLGSRIAKRAMLGDTIKILNCEKIVISGSKENTVEKYHYLMKYMGRPVKGPYYSRMPDRFVRRILRGMLPHNKLKGREAYRRIMCYIGVPVEFKNQKLIKIEGTDVSRLKTLKKAYVGEVCKAVGQK
jgi:large subunit ribosomal protein L13